MGDLDERFGCWMGIICSRGGDGIVVEGRGRKDALSFSDSDGEFVEAVGHYGTDAEESVHRAEAADGEVSLAYRLVGREVN
jgi:hypothetical protein